MPRPVNLAAERGSVRAQGSATLQSGKEKHLAKAIVMEEFHLTIYAPRGLPQSAYASLLRALGDPRLRADLRRAIRDAFRRHPPLHTIRFSVTR